MERAQRILIFQISFSQLKEPLDFLMNKHSPPRHVTFLGHQNHQLVGFLPPIWKRSWSNWIISPELGGENKTYLKTLPKKNCREGTWPKTNPLTFFGASKIPWDLLGHRPALEAPSASHPRLEAFHRPLPGSHAVFWWRSTIPHHWDPKRPVSRAGETCHFLFRESVKPFPMIFFEDL